MNKQIDAFIQGVQWWESQTNKDLRGWHMFTKPLAEAEARKRFPGTKPRKPKKS